MSETPSVIEFSINDGAAWHHGRTIEAWVRSDPASLAVQRQAVRENAREWYGNVEHVVTRVMYETDPRCVNNQPPGQDADVSTDTGNRPDMTMVLYRLDQAERRLISKHPDAAKDPELAAMLRGIRDEAAALNGDSGTPG